MILQALYKYYQQMRAAGTQIAPPGMEWKNIPFIIEIEPDGSFIQVRDTRTKTNKSGELLLVSRSVKRSGSKSYEKAQLLWDHFGYVLGIPTDDEENKKVMAPKQHKSFLRQVNTLCDRYPENKAFLAVQSFYKLGNASTLASNEEIISQLRSQAGANITFRVGEEIVACHPDLATANNGASDDGSDDESTASNLGRCLVTGEQLPIARIHPSVKLAGAQATAAIVSFQKNSGFDSYGKEQGFNAPVSSSAAEAIATAINELLTKDKETNYRIGETSFIFWSDLADPKLLESYKKATFDDLRPSSDKDEEKEEIVPEKTSTKSKRGSKARKTQTPEDESYKIVQALRDTQGIVKDGHIRTGDTTRFYILGLTPNAARISVKLWMEGTVSEIVGNTLRHLDDMNMITADGNLDTKRPPLRSLYRIVRAVSSSDKSDKWSNNLIQSIVQSIITGTPYPLALQQACVERISHDRKVTELRAAILRACINRRSKNNKTKISMALDPTQTDKAYLAGRLFRIYERIQYHALGSTNKTIRDSFYSAAMTTPSAIFGRLDNLAKKGHLSKIRKTNQGLAFSLENDLAEVMALIPGSDPGFPAHFTLEQQSIFAVGYYHERADRARKTSDTDTASEEVE